MDKTATFQEALWIFQEYWRGQLDIWQIDIAMTRFAGRSLKEWRDDIL